MHPEGAESGVARAFLNFSSSPPVIRLAEIFKWLFTSRPGFALTVSAAVSFLAVGLHLAFFDFNVFLTHDEGEHLHVVYALERGEVPYRDFMENHPVLFHLFLLWLKRLFGLTDVGHAYLLSKTLIFLHIVASIVLITLLLCRFCKWEFGSARLGLVFLVALPLLGLWDIGAFWHVRLDWIAFFYAWLAAVSHLIMLRRIIQGRSFFSWLMLGAAAFGLGAATLMKVVHVIAPYVMTLCLAAVLAPRDGLEKFFRKSRPLFWMNSLFAVLSLLFFAGFVALELRFSGADLADYIRANYALHSIKRPYDLNWNRTPLHFLRRILDLPAAAAYVLAACGVPLLLALHERKKFFLKCLAIFIGLTLLFNASFPAWSNGALFYQYFVPSVAAAALYVALLIIQLLRYAAPRPHFGAGAGRGLTANQGFAALQTALVFIALLYMAVASAYDAAKMAARLQYVGGKQQKIINNGGRGDGKAVFAPDAFLPSDLNYLTFHPANKPVAAPVWGYFFYSIADWRLWSDAHKLGFAPDPADHWRALYEKSPPDAIAAAGPENLKYGVRMINSKQEIDVSWLLESVKRDYACITRGHPAYMRNDLAREYLRQGGWRPCSKLE